MKVITLDFETYYERGDYSLRNMPTQQYINDPRFQIIGVAVGVNGGTPVWHSHDNKLGYIAALGEYELDKEGTITVAHNAMFDGAILEWILGIKPWRYFCTMMGSRPYVAPYTGRMSLESVAAHLDFGFKGKEVFGAHDKRLENFTDEELRRYANYCVNDVVLAWKIFRHIAMQMPASERRIVDLTVKKFTRPKLRLDKKVIEGALEEVRADKAELLAKAGLDSPDALMSNVLFAELLVQHGVDPPHKISPATGKTTHAFAKSDPAFMALLTAVNPQVRALMKARLKFKSTIEETRLERFRIIHNSTKTHELAAPLLYYGAHPGRFSGLDKLNLQNLGRASPLGLQAGRRWLWLKGNHDPGPIDLGGEHLDQFTQGPLTFRHIAEPETAPGEISGHYHPKARLARTSRPCFMADDRRLILPAYGCYTGGLDWMTPVLRSLFADHAVAYLTGPRVLPVPVPRAA